MPRNGSGGYLPPQNSWNPAINGAQALPNDWQAILNDLAVAMQASLAADGQTPVTGIMNFQNNRISNVGAPIGQGDVLRWEQLIKGSDIPSAATIAVPVEGMCFDVTGTTAITTISDRYPGRMAILRFKDALTLAHSANLQLPDGVDITTKSDDIGIFLNIESGVWRCISWPNGVYRRGNILGTVSQSSGIPTGAVIESGSNANGRYIKWADGTMICTGSAASSLTTSTASGSIFQSPSVASLTFPAAFSGTPIVTSDSVFTGGAARAWCFLDAATSTGCTIIAAGPTSSAVAQPKYIAIGRWF